jgi:hypothetical protein
MRLSAHPRLTLAANAILAICAGAFALSCAAPNAALAPVVAPPPAVPEPAIEPEQGEASHEPAAEPAMTIPTTCAKSGDDVCTPPKPFVNRVCGKTSPDLALTLFAKSSPWTRAYVTRDMEAWYVSSKAKRSSPKQLRRFEEVIILNNRSPRPGAVQISGAGSYDVYRWDGSCVSLMSDEVSLRSPGTPDVATIPWKKLDDNIKERLVKNRKIEFRNEKRLEQCKKLGEQAARRCESAKSGLSRMIAEYVRGGGDLPLLTSVP